MIKKISPVFVMFALLVGCGENDSTFVDNSTFSKTQEDVDSALVYVSKQEVACESVGLPMADTASVLIEAGVDVMDSDCGRKIKDSFVLECGVETTAINIHKIPSANLVDAEGMGYNSIHDLAEEGFGSGFIVEDCAVN